MARALLYQNSALHEQTKYVSLEQGQNTAVLAVMVTATITTPCSTEAEATAHSTTEVLGVSAAKNICLLDWQVSNHTRAHSFGNRPQGLSYGSPITNHSP